MVTSDFSMKNFSLMPNLDRSEKIEKAPTDLVGKVFAFNRNSDLPSLYDQTKKSIHLRTALSAILGFSVLLASRYYLGSTISTSDQESLGEKITDVSRDHTGTNSTVLWPIIGVAGIAFLATAVKFALDRPFQNNDWRFKQKSNNQNGGIGADQAGGSASERKFISFGGSDNHGSRIYSGHKLDAEFQENIGRQWLEARNQSGSMPDPSRRSTFSNPDQRMAIGQDPSQSKSVNRGYAGFESFPALSSGIVPPGGIGLPSLPEEGQ